MSKANDSTRKFSNGNNQEMIIVNSLVDHPSISVTSDADFITLGFPGDGSPSTPYLIENYNITTTDISGIFIRHTTAHFIIRNCFITADYYGIGLNNATADTATIYNNTINNNNFDGIVISTAAGVNISNNTLTNNGRGIRVWDSIDCYVFNNIISGNDAGIDTKLCNNIVIANNTFENDGLYLTDRDTTNCLTYTVENNTVNGKPLGWFEGVLMTTIPPDTYGQIFAIDGNGLTINNDHIEHAAMGICVLGVDEVSITNCIVNHITEDGVVIYHSSNVQIINTVSSNSLYGIGFNLQTINLLQINDSVASNNNRGGVWCTYCDVEKICNNEFNYNDDHGIFLEDITLPTIIHGNTLKGNDLDGACINYINDPIITYNTFEENLRGLEILHGVYNARIHHNVFLDNIQSQAVDNGYFNLWYDSANQQGNWWSDWVSGVYYITGNSGSTDPFPLNDPAVGEFSTVTVTILLLINSTMVVLFLIKKNKK